MNRLSISASSIWPEGPDLHLGSDAEHPIWFVALVFLLLVMVISLSVLDWAMDPARFPIREVALRGSWEQVEPDRIRAVVASRINGNYFSTRLEVIESAVRSQLGVSRVHIRRRWPSTLEVHVEEIQPVAFWGSDRVLDFQGDLFPRDARVGPLPRLKGPEHAKERVWETFQNWQPLFARQGLSLDQLELDDRALWYLTLSRAAGLTARHSDELLAETSPDAAPKEVRVMVNDPNAQDRIQRLIHALNSHLIMDFPQMQSIDLRYPNGFAIHWSDPPEQLSMLAESY